MSLLDQSPDGRAGKAAGRGDARHPNHVLTETVLRALSKAPRSDDKQPLSRQIFEHLVSDDGDVDGFVGGLIRNGMQPLRIAHQHLPEVAELLGEGWVTDDLGFCDVTLYCGHLMALSRNLLSETPTPEPPLDAPRVLLLKPVWETHSFGLVLLADALRRQGWRVEIFLTADRAALQEIAAGGFDVIGITCGSRRNIDAAAALIRDLRKAAPDAVMAIGGGAAEISDSLREETQADVVVTSKENPSVSLEDALNAARSTTS